MKKRNVLLISLVTVFMLVSMAVVASGNKEIDYSDPAALKGLISGQREEYVLVDVRTIDEYEAGFIPTAINIPYDTIENSVPTEDKSALIVVYCRSGRRSAIAQSALKELGYNNVVDFGGIDRWKWELEIPTSVAPVGAGS